MESKYALVGKAFGLIFKFTSSALYSAHYPLNCQIMEDFIFYFFLIIIIILIINLFIFRNLIHLFYGYFKWLLFFRQVEEEAEATIDTAGPSASA